MNRRDLLSALAASAMPLAARAQPYDPGASATEIKLGQSRPYSGPASAYSLIPKTQVAYFKMVSDKGGINGRYHWPAPWPWPPTSCVQIPTRHPSTKRAPPRAGPFPVLHASLQPGA